MSAADILAVDNDRRAARLTDTQRAAAALNLDRVEHAASLTTTPAGKLAIRKPSRLEHELLRATVLSHAEDRMEVNPDQVARWQSIGRHAAATEEAERLRARRDAALALAIEDAEAATDVPAGATWGPHNLADIVARGVAGGLEPPRPTIGRIDGADAFLFYVGQVNGLAGPPGKGKTKLTHAVTAEQLAEGEHVVLIDLEDSPEAVIAALLNMGATPEHLTRLHYIRPAEAFSAAAEAELAALIERVEPSVVIIDSVGEAFALDGVRPNDDDEVARWFRRVARAIADLGPAVILVDHVAKSEDNRAAPIGSQRKLAAITGAQYMLHAVKPFARGVSGWAAITCVKDRHGHYKAGQRAAELRVTATAGDAFTVALRAPDAHATDPGQSGGTFRYTGLMEKASRILEAEPAPLTSQALVDRIGGNASRARTALRVLVDDGHVVIEPGARNANLHRLVKPYRQTSDPLSDVYKAPDEVNSPNPGPATSTPSRPLRGDGRRGQSDRISDDRETGSEDRDEVPTAQPPCLSCGNPVLAHLATCATNTTN